MNGSLEAAIIHEAVARALGEDRGPCDITSMALIAGDIEKPARIFVKQAGVFCGAPLACEVFREVNPACRVDVLVEDGSVLEPGDDVLHITGPARDILTAERTALNFLQHLSGIATETSHYVKALEGTKARILDTRKTMPGLRALQKYAVHCGGGINHRMGLYDEFMIKDNHVELMKDGGGLAAAVQKAREFNPDAKLTVEADTLDQVAEWASLGVDQILLDNMSNEQMEEAVRIVAGRCKLEASGNMSLARVASVARCGVDFISVGALTHSVRALDFSLEILD